MEIDLRQANATQQSDRKSVTALSNQSNNIAAPAVKDNEAQPTDRPATSLKLEQEVDAIELATKVAAVGENEGARLDYDAQQEQQKDDN